MKTKPIYRLAFVLLAFLLALLLVYIFSKAGSSSEGPLRNFLKNIGEQVEETERSLIVENREDARIKKLKVFDTYRKDLEWLKNPDKILLGATDNTKPESYEPILNLEDSLRTVFPLISIYSAWGSKPHEQFPKTAVNTIIALGSTPILTWEPWLEDFDEEEIPGIPPPEQRGKGSLKAIAGGVYDSYIRKWAEDARSVGVPMFLRFGHEMNDPYRYPWGPQNNKPEDYVAAWKHIRQIFDEVGADNIIWVWAPHPAYGYFDAFYPGDEYVDYVGIGVLNFGKAATWSDWWTFEELFGQFYEAFAKYGKPLMITEFGSLVVGGDRGHWFADAFRQIPGKYPQLKSIMFFHYPADKTITSKVVNWYFVDDTATLDSIRTQLSRWPDSLKISVGKQ